MSLAFAAASLLAAAGAAPDLSWAVDGEIPARIAAAEADARKQDALAAQADELRRTALAKRQAALTEKADLEADLAEMSRGKRSEAEKKIAALAAAAEQAEARAKQLALEAQAIRSKAASQRSLAAALAAEAKSREADAAKNAIDPDADLSELSDARLKEAIAFHQRRLARVPAQLAALDAELDAGMDLSERGAVVARKDAVRGAAAVDRAEAERLSDELRFRADTKIDEALAAEALDAAAKAKALENATPSPSATTDSEHSKKVDAALDRILAKQDQAAADARTREKTMRTVARWVFAVGGFGVLALILVFVLKGRGGA